MSRITRIDRTDGSSAGFSYDQNGNMTILTTPSFIDHGFGYNGVNLNASYQTPISGTYSYVYDKDPRLAVYDGSDNLLMRFEYADARMPVAMTSSGSTYYFAYDQVGSLRIVADASGNVIKRLTTIPLETLLMIPIYLLKCLLASLAVCMTETPALFGSDSGIMIPIREDGLQKIQLNLQEETQIFMVTA